MTIRSKIIAAGTLGLFFAPIAAGAATANTTINAVISSTISISTASPVALNITPTSGGSQTTQSDTVTVNTNNSTGFTLTLEDANSNTDLANGGNTLTASSATQASPAILSNNTWGYRVDTIGGFGSGPGAATTDQSSNSLTFAGVPASGSPNTIKTTSTTASNDTTAVWYSAKATTAKPNGTYTDTVTYTATTNP